MVEQYFLFGVPFFDWAILHTVQSCLVDIISRCGHQQRDIILMNQGGEGVSPLLSDMISTRRELCGSEFSKILILFRRYHIAVQAYAVRFSVNCEVAH